jgi:hypothetical protein
MSTLLKPRGYEGQASCVYRTLVRRIGYHPDDPDDPDSTLASPEAECTCIAVQYLNDLNCAAINVKVDGTACRCTLNGSTRLVRSD